MAVTVNDDDTAVALSATPNPVTEGSTVTVTARLAAALSSDVEIPVALTADTAETDDYGPLSSITISRGKTTGTGTITTAQDTDTDDERFTVALGTLPNGVAAGSPNSVRITISDDDSSGGDGDTDPEQTVPTTLTLKAGSSPAEGRPAVRVSVALDQPSPRGGMKVKLSLGEGTATEGAGGDFTLTPMTIAIGEGERFGEATLSVVDDATDEDSETVAIQAACPNEGLTAGLGLTIADNDEAGVTVSPAALSVAEGTTAAYSVVLASKPMADVEVTARSGTPGKAAVTPATVTFTPGEWNQAKTITVTGVEAGGVTITHGASSTDGKYGEDLRIGSVAVAVTASHAKRVYGRPWPGMRWVCLKPWPRATRRGPCRTARAASAHGSRVTERELLDGSSFGLTGGAAAGGRGGRLERGAGGYHSTSLGTGAVEAALTGLYPYGGVALGLRSEVTRPPAGGEGLSLAVTGDARITYTASAAARTPVGELAATEADTWLARAGVEGTRRFALDAGKTGAWLTPSIGGGRACGRRRRGAGHRRRPGRRARLCGPGERARRRPAGARSGCPRGERLPGLGRVGGAHLGSPSLDRSATLLRQRRQRAPQRLSHRHLPSRPVVDQRLDDAPVSLPRTYTLTADTLAVQEWNNNALDAYITIMTRVTDPAILTTLGGSSWVREWLNDGTGKVWRWTLAFTDAGGATRSTTTRTRPVAATTRYARRRRPPAFRFPLPPGIGPVVAP